mmetsp:Transcript_3106/g.3436  ORF Transcript_3106/g.3436 Transcript_3106/m.3436 type:complete len:83 (+) Transcript_3106:191-439(+)
MTPILSKKEMNWVLFCVPLPYGVRYDIDGDHRTRDDNDNDNNNTNNSNKNGMEDDLVDMQIGDTVQQIPIPMPNQIYRKTGA